MERHGRADADTHRRESQQARDPGGHKPPALPEYQRFERVLAGGYGIQGPAGAFVAWMQGSFSAVVGLPLSETSVLLSACGITPATAKE